MYIYICYMLCYIYIYVYIYMMSFIYYTWDHCIFKKKDALSRLQKHSQLQ